jgi:nitrate reductase cytochrome c-type subunit
MPIPILLLQSLNCSHSLQNGLTWKAVKVNTACQATDHVAAAIIASVVADPRLGSSGNKCLQFRRQINTYKTKDGSVKHQKALVLEVYRWLLCHTTHPRELARAHLLAGAHFFAMRSCKYSKTQNSKHQKTKPIRPIDITFRNGPQIIPHDIKQYFLQRQWKSHLKIKKMGLLKIK